MYCLVAIAQRVGHTYVRRAIRYFTCYRKRLLGEITSLKTSKSDFYAPGENLDKAYWLFRS